MREEGLQGRPRKQYRATTNSDHALGYSPNVLERNFTASPAPNTIWLADITQIWTLEGWLYLGAVLDMYSRGIVGWSISEGMGAELATDALQMAIDRRRPPPGLVHHSDRGVQYASHAYRHMLDDNGMLQSMSRRGDCWDNAPMESFFSTLKRELMEDYFPTKAAARRAIFEYIEVFYNRARLHSALGYMPPAEFERQHVAA